MRRHVGVFSQIDTVQALRRVLGLARFIEANDFNWLIAAPDAHARQRTDQGTDSP